MKKKFVLRAIIVVAAILVVMGAVFGKRYYDSRYVGKDYYAMVPLDYAMTLEPIHDMSGKKQIGTGIKFKLMAYNEQGEAKEINFTVMEGGNIPQPGTYLSLNASEELVLNWRVTDESNISEKALEKIRGDSQQND